MRISCVLCSMRSVAISLVVVYHAPSDVDPISTGLCAALVLVLVLALIVELLAVMDAEESKSGW